MRQFYVRAIVQEYIEKHFLIEFNSEITGHTDLIRAGVIDSFGYIGLMGFLKEEFEINFSIEEMLTNFVSSLDGFVHLVESRSKGRMAANKVGEIYE